jgi:hypothetical protein
LAPTRILDTRSGLGEPGGPGPLGPGSTIDVEVGNHGGVPAIGVQAVVLNVTAVTPTAPSSLTVWPTSELARPEVSSLSLAPGQTVANAVTVALGGPGVSIFNAAGSTDVIVDVAGYSAGPAGSRFVSTPPSRIYDTPAWAASPCAPAALRPSTSPAVAGSPRPASRRSCYYTTGVASEAGRFMAVLPERLLDTRAGFGALGPDETVGLELPGTSPDIGALVGNVTATQPTAGAWLTVYPNFACEPPNVSTLNFVPGQTVPNIAITQLSTVGGCDPEPATVLFHNPAGFTQVIYSLVS